MRRVDMGMAGRPTLLDCTIRDGSYAINFKFTAADTALIAGLLDRAGCRTSRSATG